MRPFTWLWPGEQGPGWDLPDCDSPLLKSPDAGSGAGDGPLTEQGLFWESQPAELICKHNLFENSSWRVLEALLAAQECCPVYSGLVLSAVDLQPRLACWTSSGSSGSVWRCGSCSGT